MVVIVKVMLKMIDVYNVAVSDLTKYPDHRNTGHVRSVRYGLISRLNLTFVVALCTCSGIRSHIVTPQ